MEPLKVNGLIIREISVGESDKLVTILTDTMGKITVSCKGVRNIKSKRIAASQLFSYGEFLLNVRASKYYLSEAAVENSFFELNSSLEKLSLAQYFCQVVSCVTVENEDQSEILRLILNSFYVLCHQNKSPDFVKAVFEMSIVALLGFCPDLFECQGCGCEILPSCPQGAYLNIGAGGVICADCAISEENSQANEYESYLFLSPHIYNALRYIITSPAKKIFSFSLSDDPNSEKELADITEKYLRYHLDRGFETLDFYHSIQCL